MNVKYKTRIHILSDSEMERITRDVDYRGFITNGKLEIV